MNSNSRHVLVAEDDETDRFLIDRANKKAGEPLALAFASNGQEAIDQLESLRSKPHLHPKIVLLDLRMPRKDGLVTLEWIRAQPEFKTVPTIIFSSSSHPQDVARAYALGANAFIVKPGSSDLRTQLIAFLGEWTRFVLPGPLPLEVL
jgi:two-component system, response regulator